MLLVNRSVRFQRDPGIESAYSSGRLEWFRSFEVRSHSREDHFAEMPHDCRLYSIANSGVRFFCIQS
jgi:hypothetical protein